MSARARRDKGGKPCWKRQGVPTAAGTAAISAYVPFCLPPPPALRQDVPWRPLHMRKSRPWHRSAPGESARRTALPTSAQRWLSALLIQTRLSSLLILQHEPSAAQTSPTLWSPRKVFTFTYLAFLFCKQHGWKFSTAQKQKWSEVTPGMQLVYGCCFRQDFALLLCRLKGSRFLFQRTKNTTHNKKYPFSRLRNECETFPLSFVHSSNS